MTTGSRTFIFSDYVEYGEQFGARCECCRNTLRGRDLKIGSYSRFGAKHRIRLLSCSGGIVLRTLYYECFQCGMTTNFERAVIRRPETQLLLPAPTQDNRPPLDIDDGTVEMLKRLGLEPIGTRDLGLWTAKHAESR